MQSLAPRDNVVRRRAWTVTDNLIYAARFPG